MDFLLEALTNWLKEMLVGGIMSNLSGMFDRVMTVDLIQMIADKNNLHDVDTWMIFKWVFKSAAAILIVTNT